MIVFDLRCLGGGHVFEAWFGSSADYEAQKERGLVSCPLCGDGETEKAVMAPNVGAKGNRSEAPAAAPSADPETVKAMLAELATAQKKMLESSTHVGDRFADEARAIHLGEAEARAIHGRATRDEAERLAEEGIKVAPLPFPVAEPGQEN
jgi:hypothetical protein